MQQNSSFYKPIIERQTTGIFAVPMVHSAILINLGDSRCQKLACNPPPSGYTGTVYDSILFAKSACHTNSTMYIDNRYFYGYTLIPTASLADEKDQFLHMKLDNMGKIEISCLL
jgi:hypothetical protein